MSYKDMDNLRDCIKYSFFEWELDADNLKPAEVAGIMDEIARE